MALHKGLGRQFFPELFGLCGYLLLWHDPDGQSLTTIPGQGQYNQDPPLQPLHGCGGVKLNPTWGYSAIVAHGNLKSNSCVY